MQSRRRLADVPPHVLLIALALDRHSFNERFQADAVGDVLRTWAHESCSDQRDSLWLIYERLIKCIKDVVARSRELGVHVVENATSQDVRHAFEQNAPVTLLAHWKGPSVFGFDLHSPGLCVEAMSRRAVDGHLLLRQLIGPRELERMANLSAEQARNDLAAAINAVMIHQDFESGPVRYDHDPDEFRMAANREFIDDLFSNALRPGNRLELWDAMVDAPTFTSWVPDDRKSAIELAVCHSAVVARALQFKCNCPVVINLKPSRIVFRLHLHLQAIRHSVRSGEDYVFTLRRLRDQLIDDSPKDLP